MSGGGEFLQNSWWCVRKPDTLAYWSVLYQQKQHLGEEKAYLAFQDDDDDGDDDEDDDNEEQELKWGNRLLAGLASVRRRQVTHQTLWWGPNILRIWLLFGQ